MKTKRCGPATSPSGCRRSWGATRMSFDSGIAPAGQSAQMPPHTSYADTHRPNWGLVRIFLVLLDSAMLQAVAGDLLVGVDGETIAASPILRCSLETAPWQGSSGSKRRRRAFCSGVQ